MYHIVEIISLILVGVVVYLWQRDKNKELKRLYQWQDDMFDRINSDTIEQYAMTHRIKKDIKVQNVDARVAADAENAKLPPQFVHQKR